MVLLFSTENLLVALYAIVGIALIVASVRGTIEYVYGWELGIVESLMGRGRGRRRRRRLIDRRLEWSGPQLPVARRVEVRADVRLGARAYQ